MFEGLDDTDEFACRSDAAVEDFLLASIVPATFIDRGACEMDETVDVLQFEFRRGVGRQPLDIRDAAAFCSRMARQDNDMMPFLQ